MKSKSAKICFSSRFVFFEQEKVSNLFFWYYPEERLKKTNVSIFVDKCTVMFVMGVFQGNVKKKSENQHVEKISACHINKKNPFFSP